MYTRRQAVRDRREIEDQRYADAFQCRRGEDRRCEDWMNYMATQYSRLASEFEIIAKAEDPYPVTGRMTCDELLELLVEHCPCNEAIDFLEEQDDCSLLEVAEKLSAEDPEICADWLVWVAEQLEISLPDFEHLIIKDLYHATCYCAVGCYHQGRRWPELEKLLVHDGSPLQLYLYARDVIRGQWDNDEAHGRLQHSNHYAGEEYCRMISRS